MYKLTGVLLMTMLAGCATTNPKCIGNKGCTSVVTSEKVNHGEINEGVLYSIPKQNLEISITRSKSTKEKLEKAVKDAAAGKGELNSEIKKTEQNIKDLTAKVAAATSISKAKLTLDLELQKIDKLILKTKLNAATKKEATAGAALATYKANPDAFNDVIKLKVLDPYPDASNMYSALVNKNSFGSETIEIKTTQEGLLSGGSGTSKGQLDEIVVSAVEAFAALKSKSPSLTLRSNLETFQGSLVSSPEVNTCPKKATKFTYTADITEPNWLSKVNASIVGAGLCYSFTEVGAVPKTPVITTSIVNGLLYPRTVQLNLELHNTEPGNLKLVKKFYPNMINAGTLGYISLSKGYLADNEYEYDFKNGLLTRYKSITPNEIIEFFGLFPRVAKSIISIPSEILQLKIDYSSKEKAYYETQEALLAARLSFEAEQEKAAIVNDDD
ncbi:MAG: hypothetical protein ACI8RW_000188 [Porticoccaceae bacterium]|jgi:hypothetical protein